ncbi:MAG: hypothetical protein NWF03_03660 [Candidatus Bathyarchaeota archaeon]|nr:hypothetical protein [Candidatus Bathyarchaeota archaeon]
MSRNVAVLLICVTLTCLLCFSVCYAEVEIGVKEGDWVEYDVNVTGTVPAEHDLTWARMEYITVQGKTAEVNITSRYSDGSEAWVVLHLDLEAGQTGDSFLIPANLQEGMNYTEQYHGEITIIDVTQREYSGARRNTAHGTTAETLFYWDQETGVLLEARSDYGNYTIDTVAQKTNIWEPQTFAIDPIIFVVIIVAAIAVIVIFVIKQKMKKLESN